jgi:hypothetical protein
MKKVIRYVASDNSEFNSENDAKRHENELRTINQLKLVLTDSLQTMRIDAIVRQITIEHEKISALLRAHKNRLPRK